MDYLTCPGYNPPKASIRIIASSSSRLCGCCARQCVILFHNRDPLSSSKPPLPPSAPEARYTPSFPILHPPCHLAAYVPRCEPTTRVLYILLSGFSSSPVSPAREFSTRGILKSYRRCHRWKTTRGLPRVVSVDGWVTDRLNRAVYG